MIAKVRKGQDFGGLLRYLYDTRTAEGHHDPHRVGGNVIGDDPRTLGQQLRFFADRHPLQKPVWHASLRLPEGERLTDEQWDSATKVFLREMGFLGPGTDGFDGHDAPYVAVRHAEDHVHIAAARIRFDASVVRVGWDWTRSHRACRAVEQQFGLVRATTAPEQAMATVTKGERLSAQRRGVEPERARLRQLIEAARDRSGGSRAGFERELAAAGVRSRANVSTSGRMNGYSFTLDGWTDTTGAEVWLPASKVHKSLRWGDLSRQIERESTVPGESEVGAILRRQLEREAQEREQGLER